MDFTISEYVDANSSRQAMSLAFQKARRRFPKSGVVENCQNSSDENESMKPKAIIQEPCRDHQNYINSLPELIESSLIDSLNGIEINGNTEQLCNRYQLDSNEFATVSQNDIPVYNTRDSEVTKEQEEYLPNYLNDSQNTCEKPAAPGGTLGEPISQPSSLYEGGNEYGRRWRAEPRRFADNASKPYPVNESVHSAADFPMTNGADSDSEPPRLLEIPPRLQSLGERRRHRHRHNRRPLLYCNVGCEPGFEEEATTPTSARSTCQGQGQCQQQLPIKPCGCCHYHCHCCLCHVSLCCCARRCLSWREIRLEQERSPVRCKSSRQRKSRRRRCSLCRRRVSTRSRQPDTDSGVFTHARRSNDADEEAEEEARALLHKDSLSILQEKYVGARHCRRQAVDDEETEERRRRRLHRRSLRHGNAY